MPDAEADADDRTVRVEDEIARIARALERTLRITGGTGSWVIWRVEQVCPICRIELATTFRGEPLASGRSLHRTIFALYDEHRCVDDRTSTDVLRDMLARTDAESVRMAARAAAIEASERDTPNAINLFARAEREFVVLAEWVARIEQLLAARG